jgi:hypothetical protein
VSHIRGDPDEAEANDTSKGRPAVEPAAIERPGVPAIRPNRSGEIDLFGAFLEYVIAFSFVRGTTRDLSRRREGDWAG